MTTTAGPDTSRWTVVPEAFWDGLRRLIEPYLICRFIVPGKPQPKERRVGQGRRAYTPKLTVDAEKRVLDAFKRAMPGWTPEPDLTYGVMIEFNAEEYTRSDLDNLTKLVWDALNRELWQDDVQVGMALLRLDRYGDPGTTVSVFTIENNGTRLTKLCECGQRYRSTAKMCAGCQKRGKAIAELLGEADDADQAAAELAQLQRRAFSYITACMIGATESPSAKAIAAHLGVTEAVAGAAIDGLIAAGNLTRLKNRKLKILKPLGA